MKFCDFFLRTIQKFRDVSLPTVIIPTEINNTMVFNMLTTEQWDVMDTLDPERSMGHNRELYTVWNEKTNFMMTVAKRNYFSSEYFLWLDIGAVRHSVIMLNQIDCKCMAIL